MNILVIRFSSLGDLVTLEPAFRTIRHFFKDDNITLLTTGVGKGLYQDTNYFNRYVLHDSFIRSVNELKNVEYDLIINLQCNKPSHYISMVLNKKQVVNKSYNLLQKIFKLKKHVKTTKEIIESTNYISQDKIEEYFNRVKEVIVLPTNHNEKFINKEEDKKYIAISTGTSERWLSKKWGVENYLNLVRRLVDHDYKVVLVGSHLEIEDATYIISKFEQGTILSFVNKTNLTQLKNLLSEVDLYIGNDSGPSHIAAGVSTNTISIFGSTDVKHCVKNMPYKGEHICIKPSDLITCHPCYKPKCPTNMECMESIKVDHVFAKVEEILKQKKETK